MVIRDKGYSTTFCAMCRKSMKVGEKELNICTDCRTELHKLDKQAEKEKLKEIIAYHGGYEKWRALANKEEEEKKKWREQQTKEYEMKQKKKLQSEDKVLLLKKSVIQVMVSLGYKQVYLSQGYFPKGMEFTVSDRIEEEAIILTAGDKLGFEITWKSFNKHGAANMKKFIQEELPFADSSSAKHKYVFIMQSNRSNKFQWNQKVIEFRSEGHIKDAVKNFLQRHNNKIKLKEETVYRENTSHWKGYNPKYEKRIFGEMICKNVIDNREITFYVYSCKTRSW
ncbi:hypothetical protein ABH965_003672 [Bacillus sp. RC97]|uniref:hypothetical protein n=1 Tax=Bacillus sp. RC97 TaxID=3156294 RepID=UPI003838FCA1